MTQKVHDADQRAPAHEPDWTTWNEHDPGVTLVALFAFLAAGLLWQSSDRLQGVGSRLFGTLAVGFGAAGAAWLLCGRRKHTLPLLIILVLTPVALFAQQKSIEHYRLLAEQGDAVAQNELGVRIGEGRGTKQNKKLAVEWFKKSAAQGNALGACNLGSHYVQGSGIRKDLVEGFKWLYIAHSLDSLKCHVGDYYQFFRPSNAQDKKAWNRAVSWLRAHPELKDDFGRRPWFKSEGAI